MIILISLFTLWLFHSVSCQIIGSQQDTINAAINAACNILTDGLSSDTECALANARGVIAANGISQTLSATDLNQLCGPTACAQLFELTPYCIGNSIDERVRAVNDNCIHKLTKLFLA